MSKLCLISCVSRVVGGAAGGAKFFHDGIFFKFPDNANGLYDSEESMIKALGHELKGLMAYADCRVKDLHFPLMVLIDYRYEPPSRSATKLTRSFPHMQRLETPGAIAGACGSFDDRLRFL